MIKTVVEKIRKLLSDGEAVRYLIIGVCTTLVNFLVFAVLTRLAGVGVDISNIISVTASILFAYVTNKLIVFGAKTEGFWPTALEFLKFIGARLFTMALEVGGVWLFCTKLGAHDILTKAVINVVVIIMNYVLSKLLVFKKK